MAEIGHNTKSQHIDLIIKGLELADKAEAEAIEGHRMVAEGIARCLGSVGGKTSTLRKNLKDRFDSLGPSSLHNDYASRLLGKEGDTPAAKASRKKASNLRNSYLWMAEFPDQVDWVLQNTGARQPASMHVEWKSHQSAIIKEGVEAGSPPATIADRLLGTDAKTVQKAVERINRAAEAEERRAAEAAAQAELERKALREEIRKELVAEDVPVVTADRVSNEVSALRGFMERHMRAYVKEKLDLLEAVKPRGKCPIEIAELLGETDDRDKTARALAKEYRKILSGGDDVNEANVLAFVSRCRFGAHNAFPTEEANTIATPEWFRRVLRDRIGSRRVFGDYPNP